MKYLKLKVIALMALMPLSTTFLLSCDKDNDSDNEVVINIVWKGQLETTHK